MPGPRTMRPVCWTSTRRGGSHLVMTIVSSSPTCRPPAGAVRCGRPAGHPRPARGRPPSARPWRASTRPGKPSRSVPPTPARAGRRCPCARPPQASRSCPSGVPSSGGAGAGAGTARASTRARSAAISASRSSRAWANWSSSQSTSVMRYPRKVTVIRSARTSSPVTVRSSGSSTGERSSSAGGWVSPRPSSTDAPRKSNPPTTRTPTTKTAKVSTSGLARAGDRCCPHPAHAVPVLLGLLDHRHHLGDVVGERDQFEVDRADSAGGRHGAADPVQEARPVLTAVEDDREPGDLAGLYQGERLEQLVERAEATGQDDEGLRVLDEHRLADEEVAERDADVDPLVELLLERQLDAQPHRQPAGLLRAAIDRLHRPGAAAGDHCVAGLR